MKNFTVATHYDPAMVTISAWNGERIVLTFREVETLLVELQNAFANLVGLEAYMTVQEASR